MLKQGSYQAKINKENPPQHGHLYKKAAESKDSNPRSPKKILNRGRGLFHGTPQEVLSTATYNVMRMASSGFSRKNQVLKDFLNVFPLEAFLSIIRQLFFEDKFEKNENKMYRFT